MLRLRRLRELIPGQERIAREHPQPDGGHVEASGTRSRLRSRRLRTHPIDRSGSRVLRQLAPRRAALARADSPTSNTAVNKPVVLVAEESPRPAPSRCWARTSRSVTPTVPTAPSSCPRSPTSTRSSSARATQVDAEAIAAAPKLRVVARAGVGLDNVDVEAATKAGVMVVNAPTSNITRAAEHAVALMLATARHARPAHAALKDGEWKRSKYTGVELDEKVVGIVGLGRIGVLVAQRLSAFGVKLIAYDPYVQAGRAAQMGVRLVVARRAARRVRLHHRAPAQVHGDDRAHRRRGARTRSSRRSCLVNVARGGIVDEAALYSAIKEGRVAGAGIDVFAKEPCTDSPLFELDQVVVTPHLGASTDEAQEKAGTPVRGAVRLALAGEFVPDAVNVQGGAIAEDVKPGLPLTEKLGRVFTALAGEVAHSSTSRSAARSPRTTCKVLELAALKGVFTDVVEDSVSYVNAPLLATERGVAVAWSPSAESPDCRNVITVRGVLADGSHGLGLAARCRDRARSRADRRGQRLRDGDRADRPPVVLHLRRPPRHRRRRRPHPRRRQHQHRRDAGGPRREGRQGPRSRSRSTPPSRAETLEPDRCARSAPTAVRSVDLA